MVVEQIVEIRISRKIVKIPYTQHTHGYRTLIALDEPKVETRSPPESESQSEGIAQGIERRGRLNGWNFPERRKA